MLGLVQMMVSHRIAVVFSLFAMLTEQFVCCFFYVHSSYFFRHDGNNVKCLQYAQLIVYLSVLCDDAFEFNDFEWSNCGCPMKIW